MFKYEAHVGAKAVSMVQIVIAADPSIGVVVGPAIVDTRMGERQIGRIADRIVEIGILHIGGDHSLQVFEVPLSAHCGCSTRNATGH